MKLIAITLALCVLVVAVKGEDWYEASVVEATIRETEQAGQQIRGWVRMETVEGGTEVSWSVEGLDDGSYAWHVHEYGDLFDWEKGTSLGGHFVGECDNCRPSLSPPLNDEAGAVGVASPIVSEDGSATDSFVDTIITLSEENSAVGRGIVIHHPDGGARIAIGVFGVTESTRRSESGNAKDKAHPEAWRAVCHLSPTDAGELSAAAMLGSFVQFDKIDGGLRVQYLVFGLDSSHHTMHVHTSGNISSSDGSAAGGHFVGDCDQCRPAGSLQEVGLLGDGVDLTGRSRHAIRGFFNEQDTITTRGPNDIVGRSVIVHNSAGARVAQCTIGVGRKGFGEGWDDDEYDEWSIATEAACFPERIGGDGWDSIDGMILFTEPAHQAQGVLEVRSLLSGFNDDRNSYTWHIHENGNICDNLEGTTPSGHFVGDCNNCRPGAALQEVGLVNDGESVDSNSANLLRSIFDDDVITFTGVNSIIGRSVVVHRGDGARVAQCIIGGTKWRQADSEAERPPGTTAAGCRFRPVGSTHPNVGGWASIAVNGVDGGTDWTLRVSGLEDDTSHTWHLHIFGSTLAEDAAQSASGHFKGSCGGSDGICRPFCPANADDEIGQIGGCEHPIVSDGDGVATLSFNDPLVPLSGRDSPVGRSLIIHAPGGARIAQCVVGLYDTNAGADNQPSECYLLTRDEIQPSGDASMLAASFFLYIMSLLALLL